MAVAPGLISPLIFFCLRALDLLPRCSAILSKNKNQKLWEEPMLDAVMIAFLFLSALCVVLVLADEIRTSLSRLRARRR